MFYAKKALLCDPKLQVKRRTHTFHSTCAAAVLHGAGEWAYTQSMFRALRVWELGKLRRCACAGRPNESWTDETYWSHCCSAVGKSMVNHVYKRWRCDVCDLLLGKWFR